MTADLPKLVLFAHDSSLAFIQSGGEVDRTFAAINGDGELMVAIAPNVEGSNDAKLITYLRVEYAMEGVTEYVMFCEAWSAEYQEGNTLKPIDRPDRREVLIALHVVRQQDEDGTRRMLPTAYSWDIVTTDGKRTLADEPRISHDVSAQGGRALAKLITAEPIDLPEALIATYRQEKAKRNPRQ